MFTINGHEGHILVILPDPFKQTVICLTRDGPYDILFQSAQFSYYVDIPKAVEICDRGQRPKSDFERWSINITNNQSINRY